MPSTKSLSPSPPSFHPLLPRGLSYNAHDHLEDVDESNFTERDRLMGNPSEVEDAGQPSNDRGSSLNSGSTEPSLNAYERKSLLINREFDRMGMGSYQWAIFCLCGFGYFLDLLWAQAFGFIVVPIAQEMDVSALEQANIFTAFSAGLTVGALTWGILVDVIGRKWSFNLTCLITSIFGTLIAAPPHNWKAICAITAFCGFGLGGNIPIDATITLEFLPQNRRFLLALLSMFQPLGVAASSLIALGLVPRYRCDTELPACDGSGAPCCSRSSNMGWRYFLIVLGAITLIVFVLRFAVFNFYESPRFLVACGKDQEAVDVVTKIGKFNRSSEWTDEAKPLTIEAFREIDESFGAVATSQATAKRAQSTLKSAIARLSQIRLLFSTKKLAITTVLLWVTYMGDFWAFNIAGAFLPIILARQGEQVEQSVTETYTQYVIIYTPGIIGSFFAAGSMGISRVGRKWAMVFSAALMAVSMFLYVSVRTIQASVGLNALEYIMQTYFNALLYAFTPEVYDGPFRGTACGLASTIGRLAGIVAPKAAAPYLAAGSNGVLYMAGGGALVAMVAVAFIPIETKNRQTY